MKCPKCNYENKDDVAYCGLCYEVLKKAKLAEPVENIKKLPKKSYKWIILLVTSSVFIFLLFIQWSNIVEIYTARRITKGLPKRLEKIKIEQEILESKRREEFKPYTGEINISINPVTNFGNLTKEEFVNFRKSKVAEYSLLNIFKDNYEPCNNIFGLITFGIDWINDAQFYICNPYLLVILTQARSINPLIKYCGSPKIRYSYGVIEESYYGTDASQLFSWIFSDNEYSGTIRIWTVNAYDTGLCYAAIDRNKSANIDFTWNAAPQNITNSVCNPINFFHVGGRNKNNLSPDDNRAKFKLLEKDKYTSVYVKLWIVKPSDINQKEDFAYIIKIIP